MMMISWNRSCPKMRKNTRGPLAHPRINNLGKVSVLSPNRKPWIMPSTSQNKDHKPESINDDLFIHHAKNMSFQNCVLVLVPTLLWVLFLISGSFAVLEFWSRTAFIRLFIAWEIWILSELLLASYSSIFANSASSFSFSLFFRTRKCASLDLDAKVWMILLSLYLSIRSFWTF